MKSNLKARLDKLLSAVSQPAHPSPADMAFKKSLLAIVAAHVGKWNGQESAAEAVARALDISPREFRAKLSTAPGGLWAQIMTLVDELASSRLDAEPGDFEAYEALFDGVSEELKHRLNIPARLENCRT